MTGLFEIPRTCLLPHVLPRSSSSFITASLRTPPNCSYDHYAKRPGQIILPGHNYSQCSEVLYSDDGIAMEVCGGSDLRPS